VEPSRLYVNHMAELDRLAALEFGRTDDGHPAGALAAAGGELWEAPRFRAPQLGLTDSPAGEIVIAVRAARPALELQPGAVRAGRRGGGPR
jgi:hypothetical protein